MNTSRAFMILTAFGLSLNACSAAPAEPDPEPIEEAPATTAVPFAFIGDQPHASFDAFAQAVGSADSKEETTLLAREGKGSATGFITTGGLIARGGGTQRVLLAGKPGALYEVAVLDSWSEAPDFMPYAQVRLDGEDLPEGIFQLSYDAGRTKEVDGGTSYDHTGTALLCKEAEGRIACASFTVSKGSYVEPKEGASDYDLPNGIIVGRDNGAVEVMHLVGGDELTPAGYYTLTGP